MRGAEDKGLWAIGDCAVVEGKECLSFVLELN